MADTDLAARLRAVDWPRVAAALDERGVARLPNLLTPAECGRLAALWEDRARFRSAVVMECVRFGRGEYRYFARPLPAVVARLRAALYPPLAAIANRWRATLGGDAPFPERLDRFLARCAAHGQRRPTPLLLRYGVGDFNRLHQDLYGRVAFPLQVAIGLDRPGRDYEGGEFLLLEQRPRMQSRGTAITLAQGEAVVFPSWARPVAGRRGASRATMRHGASEVTRGVRRVLGIIFHDAA
ncbi:MAG TPA: 2OG-Fe(II) oxygenase [Candidatus Limnocylindria bacterium]|nr:2OG-Fe(II) oxygenase [Candidatus Limnocylindria bacterium]